MRYLVLLLFVSNFSQAQDCSQIEDKLARLECYDQNAPKEEIDAQILSLRVPMLERLKSPGSAQFKNETIYKNELIGSDVLCGEVNAHNSWGAYTGFSPFITFKNSAVSIEAKNRGLVGLLCKDTLASDFPGAVLKNDDSYIELARTMLGLNIDLDYLAVYKDEFLKPLGKYNAACGHVDYPYINGGYKGFKRYLMAGVGAIHDRGGESGSLAFEKAYSLFCTNDASYKATYESWYLFNRDGSPVVASIQDNSSIIISCKNNEPYFDLYTAKGIFLNKEVLENDSADEKYRAVSHDLTSMSVNLNKRSGKKLLADFASNPKTILKINYSDKLEFDTSGFHDAINEFQMACSDYNWKKYWPSK